MSRLTFDQAMSISTLLFFLSNSSALRSSKSYHCGETAEHWIDDDDDDDSSDFDDEN